MKKSIFPIMVLGFMLTALLSCAKMQQEVAIDPAQGSQKTIEMQADSYEFRPNNIKASRGDTIVLSIRNVSSKEHNFTIKNPHGKILQSVDLPEKKTIPVTITLEEAGKYDFFCSKPFHPGFGMKGQIEAVAP